MNTSGGPHASMTNDGSSGYGATYGTANGMQVNTYIYMSIVKKIIRT